MKRKAFLPLALSVLIGIGLLGAFQLATADRDGHEQEWTKRLSHYDRQIGRHAERMIEIGRLIFRFDTFGSEAFFGDALQLHKAIAGQENGGVGAGVSPKTALSVGLKVDVDALPNQLKAQLAAGKVDLDNPQRRSFCSS